jgi:plasmid stabilization system protein ParE
MERSPDAVLSFDAELDHALWQIIQGLSLGRQVLSTRRFLLRQVPFTLIDRQPGAGSIQILAVAHTSRKPNDDDLFNDD